MTITKIPSKIMFMYFLSYKKWSKKSKRSLGVVGQNEGNSGAPRSKEEQWGERRKFRHMAGSEGFESKKKGGAKSELKSSEVILKVRFAANSFKNILCFI